MEADSVILGDIIVKREMNETNNIVEIYHRHVFVTTKTALAVPVLVLLSLASCVGTLGNLLILTVVFMKKNWHHVELTFIGNLAIADLYVTVVADPMSVLGM